MADTFYWQSKCRLFLVQIYFILHPLQRVRYQSTELWLKNQAIVAYEKMGLLLVHNPLWTWCFDDVEKLSVRPEENWLYFIEWEANDKCMYLGRWENAIFSQMYQNTLLICTHLAVIKFLNFACCNLRCKPKLNYCTVGWSEFLYASVTNIKSKICTLGWKWELHEHPTCVIFLMFLCWTKKNVIFKSTTSCTKMALYWEVLSNMNRSILYQKRTSYPDFKDTLNGKRSKQP